MKYYPIIIPTLNRYEHFRNCVESLSKCAHAEKTELVIGLDYPPNYNYIDGNDKIKEYIPTINGFAKVTVFEHETNLGAGGNTRFLVEYCRQHYDAYIATEDDNVFGPAFLDYMNKALEMFKEDDNIITVSGYNFRDAYNQGKYSCYLSMDNCAWGTGCWFHKEDKLKHLLADNSYFRSALYSYFDSKKIIQTYPALYSMLNAMVAKNTRWGDVMRTTINILTNKYQLRPSISLVRNCGYDGSGLHCGTDEFGLSTQPISNEMFFDFSTGVGPADTETNKEALYNHVLHLNSNERRSQLQNIRRLFLYNTIPGYSACCKLEKESVEIVYKLRAKLAIRTRAKLAMSKTHYLLCSLFRFK